MFTPSQHFAFFTIQTSVINIAVLSWAAWQSATRERDSVALTIARSYIVTYAVITALVFNVLVRAEPEPGAYISPILADEMLHSVVPAYLLIDWLLDRTRPKLGWATAAAATYFPVLWVSASLWREGIDGWVPYPFLDPANGAASVGIYVAVLTTIVWLIASALTAYNRRHAAKLEPSRSVPHETTTQRRELGHA